MNGSAAAEETLPFAVKAGYALGDHPIDVQPATSDSRNSVHQGREAQGGPATPELPGSDGSMAG